MYCTAKYALRIYYIIIYTIVQYIFRFFDSNRQPPDLRVFSQTLRVCLPCCGARIVRPRRCSVALCDRCHSLASLLPPPAAVTFQNTHRPDSSHKRSAFAYPVAVPASCALDGAQLPSATAATRSPPCFRHRRRSARSPNECSSSL